MRNEICIVCGQRDAVLPVPHITKKDWNKLPRWEQDWIKAEHDVLIEHKRREADAHTD